MIEIRLLGQFDVRFEGESVKLPSRGAQTLFAYLLLNRDKRYRREMVAGVLWSDTGEPEARGKLRYALWELRKALGDEYILADKVSIGFNSNFDWWLDVAVLEDTNTQGLSSRELQRAVSVYEGELLPGFYEDWVVLERERLRFAYDNKMELYLQNLLEERSWHNVLEVAEKWISSGGTPEPAFRALMIAHMHLGDVSSAASVFQRCVQALQAELGVEPSQETQMVYEQISRGEKPGRQLFGKATATPRPHTGTQRSPTFLETEGVESIEERRVFIARENELTKLEGMLENAINGDGNAAFIRGDAGRGKTALLREFSRQALQRYDDLIIAYGSGEASTGLGDPHLLFRDVLSLLTGDIEYKWAEGVISREGALRLWYRLPQSVQALIETGPDLIESFVSGESILLHTADYHDEDAGWRDQLEMHVSLIRERPAPLNIQHSDLQKDLFEQYTKVLLRISHNAPLLVILDDLQWADLGSISLLFHLGRRIEGHRVMVLGVYRPDELAKGWQGEQHPLAQVLTELRRKYGENEIDLDQSDAVTGQQFVDAYLDTEANQLDEKFRKALHRRTGGHPLFTIELLRHMQAQGDLQKDKDGRWVEGPSLGWDALPARVEAVIAGRINRLPDYLRNILRVASVEGEDFSAQVIAEVNSLEESTIVQQLSQELDQRYILVEATGMQRIGQQRLSRYRFRHHLFHQYVYSSLDRVERTHLHEDVGEALEKLYAGQTYRIAVRLAKHFEEAGLVEKAADYLYQAGENAKRQSANEEAIGHLMKGLELLEDLPEDSQRVRRELALQIAVSAPLVAIKGYTSPEAESTFERARALCERIDDVTQLAPVLWGLWSFYLVRADFTTTKRLAEEILSLAQSSEEPNLELTAHWTMGITLFHSGEFSTAQDHLSQALERYDSQEYHQLTYLYGQNPAVTCLIYSAYSLWFLGYPDQALDRYQMALRLAEQVSHSYSLAFVHGMGAVFFAIRMEIGAALEHAQQALNLSKEGGFPFMMALGLVMRGWARAMTGKTSFTIGQIRRGIDAMEMIGADLGRPLFLYFLAEAYRKAGEIDEALKVVEQAIDTAGLNHERLNESDLFRLKGDLLVLRAGADEDILDNFQKALDTARQQKAKMLHLRALISLYRFWEKSAVGEDVHTEFKEHYTSFTEGHNTAYINEARNLLGLDN